MRTPGLHTLRRYLGPMLAGIAVLLVCWLVVTQPAHCDPAVPPRLCAFQRVHLGRYGRHRPRGSR